MIRYFVFLLLCGASWFFISDTHADITLRSQQLSLAVLEGDTVAIEPHQQNLDIKVQRKNMTGEDMAWELILLNTGSAGLQLPPLTLTFTPSIVESQDVDAGLGSLYFTYKHPFIWTKEDGISTIQIASLGLGESEVLGWFTEQEFEAIRVLVPGMALESEVRDRDEDVRLVIDVANDYRMLNPGEAYTLNFEYLRDNKSRKSLQENGLNGLLLVNLWQWLRQLCFLFWDGMNILFSQTNNWGITIILIAVIVQVLVIPVTKVARKYQEIATIQKLLMIPILAEVKRNYEGVEQSRKIIAAYEKNNYDNMAPFKSMLGLLIQIPILIALFNILAEMFELKGVSFLWIADLSRSDRMIDMGFSLPYFGKYFNFLPVLLGLVTCLSSWLVARKVSPEGSGQAGFSIYGLGALYFILFYSFPSALVLYWLTSNFLQMLYHMFSGALARQA